MRLLSGDNGIKVVKSPKKHKMEAIFGNLRASHLFLSKELAIWCRNITEQELYK